MNPKRRLGFVLVGLVLLLAVAAALMFMAENTAESCTVAVISAHASPDGRPMIWKNFDMSQYWHQQVKYYPVVNTAAGRYYLLYHDNDSIWAASGAITPQSGVNEAGFALGLAAVAESNPMHESSNYNTHFLGDAVANCASLTDFEAYAKTWPQAHKGHAVSANFVAIDALGGAALYEMYTGSGSLSAGPPIQYKKYDANNGQVSDSRGNVITPAQGNSFIGFYAASNLNSYFPNNAGKERYERANSLLAGLAQKDPVTGKTQLNSGNIMRIVSKDVTSPSGGNNSSYSTTYCISRSQTRSGTVVEGVPAGGDPRLTVFWTALGEPSVSVYIPTIVGARSVSPYARADSIQSDGTIVDQSDKCLLNLAEDARETYNNLIYSSNRGSAVSGPNDKTINKNELAKVQQWTFVVEATVVQHTNEYLNELRNNPALVSPEGLEAFQNYAVKYVYDNYTAGSAAAVPWESALFDSL
ncbi:MAG: hypothetical protein ACM3QZ_08190 [Solirubrobacterales bacterium]